MFNKIINAGLTTGFFITTALAWLQAALLAMFLIGVAAVLIG
jgi:hypothetical protein